MARPISLLGTIVQVFGRRVSDIVVLEQVFQLLYSFLEVKDITGRARRQYFLLSTDREAKRWAESGVMAGNRIPAGGISDLLGISLLVMGS